ncbi:FAD-dependent oxidoreductase [Bradyrhizobium sp. URHD0069]|uniref:FAD-dependent oxidoreductase n=1 Tax=Bradyrhizobium sp. URHD0069 TaxID=1380355 RepID=UPI0004960CE7|nr:FAD-dependent oxidoreductase [Bradyrhizobium sp. URHD0069]
MAWQRAASLESIPENGVLGVEIAGTPVALYRLKDEVYATHGVCTHALALLAEGFVEDGKIECPLHQGVFDIRSGKALCAPLTRDLQTFAVKVEGGEVFVALDQSAHEAGEKRPEESTLENAAATGGVVVIGAGQAAAAAIIAMREAGFGGTIDLIGDEPHPPYERPPLSKEMLSGQGGGPLYRLTEEDATRQKVKLHLGIRAAAVDSAAQTVRLDDGTTLSYGALLLTTGGRARRLTVPGTDLPNVLHLRTIEDAAAIDRAFGNASDVCIIGGGFIGLELASAASARGLAVTLLEREAEIMSRLLPASLGRVFRKLAQQHQVDLRLNADVRAIVERGRRLGIDAGGEIIEADLVLVGIGLEPELDLAQTAGCQCAGGIVVDADGRTSVPRIWAAGDCALHHIESGNRALRLESWHNAEEQGDAAGRSIAGVTATARKAPWFWTDQFSLNIQMLGLVGAGDLVAHSGVPGAAPGAVYRTIDRNSGRLTGVVAFSKTKAIREARAELEKEGPFDLAAAGAQLLNAISASEEINLEVGDMNANPPLSITTRYVWPKEGLRRIPDWVYTDQTIYEREIERIFQGRTWNYVALECEVPNPGDYIRSNVGPTPVVVSRAEDGTIHVFENRCAHRAAEFCRELSGNAKEFVCPYHQWSYDLKGNLAGVPFRRGVDGKGGMPKDFHNADHGLRRLNVTTHRGVVFASYRPDMETLQEYLGPEILAEFEATFDGRKPRLLGHYRHTLPGNWKLYHENLKDPYHATLLHTFLVSFGLLVAGNKSLMLADPTGRHGVMASAKSDKSVSSESKNEMRAYREGMELADPRLMNFIEEFDSPWSVTMATIWPNLIIQREMNTLGVRQIVPTGPHEFIMKWTMFGFEGDDEEMTRHRLRQGNLMGPAGFLGLEDNEAIKFVQDGMQHVPNGNHLVELDPAVAMGTSDTLISEAAIRGMYQHWRQEMGL